MASERDCDDFGLFDDAPYFREVATNPLPGEPGYSLAEHLVRIEAKLDALSEHFGVEKC